MKIISKYKDYYDYLQGIYGIDEKLILDRTVAKVVTKNIPLSNLNALIICGKCLEFVYKDGHVYFGENIKEISKEITTWNPKWMGPKPKYLVEINDGWRKETLHVDYPNLSEDVYKKYTYGIQKYSKQYPIFLIDGIHRDRIYEFPCLAELGANKIIDAHTIWIMLSEWLGQRITEKEPTVPVGDDKVRIQSAGFDLKTSFRH